MADFIKTFAYLKRYFSEGKGVELLQASEIYLSYTRRKGRVGFN